MTYFLETSDTIGDGLGFQHFGPIHLCWLAAAAVIIAANCILYRKLSPAGQDRWKKVSALLIIANELFKHTMLLIGGNFTPSYLPLHLCSINIFLIAIHAWHPTEMLSNFLFTVCIPGAMAALLFPSWTKLPVLNFMHLHSSTIHIQLVMYPMVLAVSGVLKPSARGIPKCLGLLVLLAGVALVANLVFDTNFMFLMEAEKGNPLYAFEQIFGSHLVGFPILITAVLVVMYVPMELYRKQKRGCLTSH